MSFHTRKLTSNFEFHALPISPLTPKKFKPNSTESTNTIESIRTSPFLLTKTKFYTPLITRKYSPRDEANLRMTTTKRKPSITTLFPLDSSSPSRGSQERKARRPLRRAFLRSSSTNAEGGGEGDPDSAPIFTQRYDVVCFRGNAQIYSGTAEHVARAALHKSAVRGVQELRKVSL